MEFIVHFFFTVIQMAILASIYATLTLVVFRLFSFFKKNSFADRLSNRKTRFWFLSGALYSFFLFAFSMSHWGNHGLGDFARVPLRFSKSVNAINSDTYYIDREYEFGQLEIQTFTVTDEYLIGKTDKSTVDDPPDYFVWNLRIDSIQYFETVDDYNSFATEKSLPTSDNFRSFSYHYEKFWNRWWRKWLLL